MANGKIRFGKQAGGELALVIPDGIDNTEVLFPESGDLATKEYIDNTTVKLTGDDTIAGIKTFSSDIVGNITGNADTATALATARTINGVAFDGTANIIVPVSDDSAVNLTENQTIGGIKTFSSSPIVPTPSTDFQVANKQYVDSTITADRIGLIDYGYVAKNYHIVAFGGEFNRADYPKLWAYLQANPALVKTQAQWTSESTTNGGICGFFSNGNGTTTFRVPNLNKAFLRPDSRSIGSYQSDAFQGHYHSLYGQHNSTNVGSIKSVPGTTTSNTFLNDTSVRNAINDGVNGTPRVSNETRPKNIAVLPLIVAK